MNDVKPFAGLSQWSTSNLCSADIGARVMDNGIRPLSPGLRFFGPARTARVSPGENGAIHRAATLAEPGDVLVIDAQGDTTCGRFGDILAAHCQRRGVAGVILDGVARDLAELRRMIFPIHCRGASPRGPAKKLRDEVDVAIQCGGVCVEPGDFVFADDDGVVVISHSQLEAVAPALERVSRNETVIRRRIENGESTCAIFNITP